MIFEEYWNRLQDAAPIDYYASGIDGARVHWPWRMNKAGSVELRQAFIDACDTHIMDSNFKDDTVTNEVVLDQAQNYGSDGAVLADVYQDAQKTIDALLDGLELAADHNFDGFIVLPLQDPHVDVYNAVEPSIGKFDVWWSIGGLKDRSADEKIDAAKKLRIEVGNDPHIHGLGFGATDVVAKAVRKNPNLLDSIDSSSATQNADVSHLNGVSGNNEITSVKAMKAQAQRVEAMWKFTHWAGEETPAEIRPSNQHGFEAFSDS